VQDYSFLVRAAPCHDAKQNLIVLSLCDISPQKLHASLQRAFLHDLSNIIGALSASAEMLRCASSTESVSLTNDIFELTQRLSRELLVQKLLQSDEPHQYRQNWQTVSIGDTLAFLQRLFANHPAAATKRLVIDPSLQVSEFATDPSLLERVLINMLTNAFEATGKGQRVRLSAAANHEEVTFSVWNCEPMDETVASRVFQRHFSTKRGLGRGQGTYAMRLIGEQLLGGRISFSTSIVSGTTFSLRLPTYPKQAGRSFPPSRSS
jgi:signal transduction histidine kinase